MPSLNNHLSTCNFEDDGANPSLCSHDSEVGGHHDQQFVNAFIPSFMRETRKTALTSFLFESGVHFNTAIDEAQATSTYRGNGGAPRNMHNARMALNAGTGYWCSKGHHPYNDTVTWEGLLRRRRPVKAIKINWAYAPGEVRVRSSPDGVTWDEAVSWHTPRATGVTFEEDMFFDRERNVKQFAIDMRHPRPWNYFGINQVVLTM